MGSQTISRQIFPTSGPLNKNFSEEAVSFNSFSCLYLGIFLKIIQFSRQFSLTLSRKEFKGPLVFQQPKSISKSLRISGQVLYNTVHRKNNRISTVNARCLWIPIWICWLKNVFKSRHLSHFRKLSRSFDEVFHVGKNSSGRSYPNKWHRRIFVWHCWHIVH